MKKMSVSEVAKAAGLSADTIRYYGRLGLLPEAGRTAGGHRYFDERTLERLTFIKGAQWFDLRLDEIRELLAISDDGLCPCHETRSLLERKIAVIEAQRARLDHIHRVLKKLLSSAGEEGFNEAAMTAGADHRSLPCACHGGDGGDGGDELQRLILRRSLIDRRLATLH